MMNSLKTLFSSLLVIGATTGTGKETFDPVSVKNSAIVAKRHYQKVGREKVYYCIYADNDIAIMECKENGTTFRINRRDFAEWHRPIRTSTRYVGVYYDPSKREATVTSRPVESQGLLPRGAISIVEVQYEEDTWLD